jgi:hypothetical protein
MVIFDRSRQHDYFTCATRHQRKPTLRRTDIGQRPKHFAKPSDFDSQPHSMRFIDGSRSECVGKELVSSRVPGPDLSQSAYQCEQHGTRYERNHYASITNDIPACVYDQRLGR